jgi:general secretion pathway protein K
MQGRFNLNNLVRADGSVNDAAVQQFERLLIRLGMEPRWARITADWLDTDTVPGVPEGAEDGVYLSQVPPYRAANGTITTTSELMALPGFGLDNYVRLRPYVAALPLGTRVNVCTASAPVLESLVEGAADFGNAEALARNRADGCFPTLDDLKATLGETQFQTISGQLSETSNWFRAVTTVSIGTSQLTLYSLMERDGSGVSRTVLRSIGTE